MNCCYPTELQNNRMLSSVCTLLPVIWIPPSILSHKFLCIWVLCHHVCLCTTSIQYSWRLEERYTHTINSSCPKKRWLRNSWLKTQKSLQFMAWWLSEVQILVLLIEITNILWFFCYMPDIVNIWHHKQYAE